MALKYPKGGLMLQAIIRLKCENLKKEQEGEERERRMLLGTNYLKS